MHKKNVPDSIRMAIHFETATDLLWEKDSGIACLTFAAETAMAVRTIKNNGVRTRCAINCPRGVNPSDLSVICHDSMR